MVTYKFNIETSTSDNSNLKTQFWKFNSRKFHSETWILKIHIPILPFQCCHSNFAIPILQIQVLTTLHVQFWKLQFWNNQVWKLQIWTFNFENLENPNSNTSNFEFDLGTLPLKGQFGNFENIGNSKFEHSNLKNSILELYLWKDNLEGLKILVWKLQLLNSM